MNLIKDGADFEDSLLRPINHFYDPVSGDALLPLLAKSSPTWALEDKGSILLPLWQRYSLVDAHDYLHKALKLPDKTEREENFGLTFETLGRVVHHIQDMAQPQHVRLDAHLKLSDADQPDWFFERGSRYESHTLALGNNLPFTGYPTVMFDTARKFWAGQGLGIADFTNRNFLSTGTLWLNLTTPDPNYPSPRWNEAAPEEAWIERLLQDEGKCPPSGGEGNGDCGNECGPPLDLPPACALTGEMLFYATNITDASGNSIDVNPRASTLSIFDQDLIPQNKRLFALNRFNFNEVYRFLIPSAVAYSAGLIDFFFRGRIEVLDVSDDDSLLTIEIKNVSGTQHLPKDGSFTLCYDTRLQRSAA